MACRLRRMSIRAAPAIPFAATTPSDRPASRPPSKDRSKMAVAANFSCKRSSYLPHTLTFAVE